MLTGKIEVVEADADSQLAELQADLDQAIQRNQDLEQRLVCAHRMIFVCTEILDWLPWLACLTTGTLPNIRNRSMQNVS